MSAVVARLACSNPAAAGAAAPAAAADAAAAAATAGKLRLRLPLLAAGSLTVAWAALPNPPRCPAAGHEIVGVVTEVGAGVRRFKVGDRAAVGCMVGSCGE